jgi:hypothetical protein
MEAADHQRQTAPFQRKLVKTFSGGLPGVCLYSLKAISALKYELFGENRGRVDSGLLGAVM